LEKAITALPATLFLSKFKDITPSPVNLLLTTNDNKKFQTDRTSIVRHINNIYKVEELDRESTCAKIAQVQMEGSRKVNLNHPDVAEPIMQVLLMEHHSLCYFSCFHGKPAPK
jgi:hypothetical protein